MDTSTRSSKKKYYVTEHYFLMFFACRMTSLVLLVMVMLISFHPILIWTTRSDLRTILMLLLQLKGCSSGLSLMRIWMSGHSE